MTSAADDQRVIIWAPRGRDGTLALEFLGRARFRASTVSDVAELVLAIERGVGCLLLTEEVLTPLVVDRLVATLANQPAWSDLPIVVFGEKLVARPLVDGASPL